MSNQYKVYLTPKSMSGYGSEIEITDYVTDNGLSSVRRGIDSTDYEIGTFFFDDLKLKCLNIDGYFNDETDYRSVFPYGRDLAKVRVEYTDSDGANITFRGLVAEEATKIDSGVDEIEFRVLSRDSVIRNVKVPAGSISNGMLVSAALEIIFTLPEIAAVLNYSDLNNTPDYDHVIDIGSKLENQQAKSSINKLLFSSNSVMLVDDSDNVIIRSRLESGDRPIVRLFGPYDLRRRQNVIDIKNVNLGRHRMFTSVRINDTEEQNAGYALQFGFRQKRVDIDYITNPLTEAAIAQRILREFKSPKNELEVTVPTKFSQTVQILDMVSIDHPLRNVPPPGKFFPVVGQTQIGDTEAPIPASYGSVSINPDMAFKVIEIKDDPKSFETTLKLRQTGDSIGDGYFSVGTCGVLGFAIVGVHTICGVGDPAETWNPSVIGAARIGFTRVAS